MPDPHPPPAYRSDHPLPAPPADAPWDAVDVWRKAERARLIEARLGLPADIRAALSRSIAHTLSGLLGPVAGLTVSLYWPFRGEPDLRPWMDELTRSGARCALPVVVRKAAPLEFRRFAPGDALEKGVWNIPVPAAGDLVLPDVVIAPLVGFDAQNYRLGYGGGFFDRTLAAMPARLLVVGVGYSVQSIATIRPQPHDIPMDRLVVADVATALT